MKKILGPLLLVIFVLGVIAAIFFSAREQFASRSIVKVHGLIGSEKEDFFKDPRVVEALRKARLEVEVQKAGSRQIAQDIKQGDYDFASPSGVPAAQKMLRDDDLNVVGSYEVFFTPMAFASWETIVQILEANGVATKQEDYYLLDMDQLLDMFVNNVTWADLEDNSGYDVNKRVLISSTDVRSSNSAAMLLALASFVLNDNNIVQDTSEVAGEKMDILTNLFQAQGFQAGSSAVPFNDYLTMGIGKAPIVMIYESQFIYQSTSEGGMKPGMVLVYPQPTIYTKHFIIALSEEGDLLGKLLRNDPDLQEDPQLQEAASELQKLAIEHGFRNADATYFAEFTRQNNVVVSDTLVNVIEPPTYEVLEAMIQDIEQRY